jgi:hypothetical protein
MSALVVSFYYKSSPLEVAYQHIDGEVCNSLHNGNTTPLPCDPLSHSREDALSLYCGGCLFSLVDRHRCLILKKLNLCQD